LPRSLTNRGRVTLNGQFVPLVAPSRWTSQQWTQPASRQVQIGDVATIYGPPAAHERADNAHTDVQDASEVLGYWARSAPIFFA